MIPEMLNLLGCNKENFKKLNKKNMNYKIYKKIMKFFLNIYQKKKKKKI